MPTDEPQYIDPKRCPRIQWRQLHLRDGKPACPVCGEPAEQILGFAGQPCWAHTPKPKPVPVPDPAPDPVPIAEDSKRSDKPKKIQWERSAGGYISSKCGRWQISPVYAGSAQPSGYRLNNGKGSYSTQREAKEAAQAAVDQGHRAKTERIERALASAQASRRVTPGPWTLQAGRSIQTPSGTFHLAYFTDSETSAPGFRSFVELDNIAAVVALLPDMIQLIQRWADFAEAQVLEGKLAQDTAALAQKIQSV